MANDLLTTKLIEAVQNGDAVAVNILLKAGADANSKLAKTTQQNLLGFACYKISDNPNNADKKKYEKIVKALLKHGANPNMPGPTHLPSPLLFAVQANNTSVVKALLRHKADPNYDFDKKTPLAAAAEIGNTKMGKLLIKHGADPTIKNKHDYNPFEIAYGYGHKKFAKMLPNVRTQTWLIDRIQKIYPTSRPEGDCFAVAHVGIQAALARDLPSLNERFERIAEIPTAKIPEMLANAKAHEAKIFKETRAQVKQEIANISSVSPRVLQIFNQEIDDAERILTPDERAKRDREKANLLPAERTELNKLTQQFRAEFTLALEKNKKTQLSETELKLLDFEILGGEIKLYQQPKTTSVYSEGRNDPLRAQKTMKVLQPAELDKKGGITAIDNFSGIYTEAEMTTHFKSLKAILDKANLEDPIAMHLGSDNHSISVVYDPKTKTWTLIDANQFPVAQDIYGYPDEEKALAKRICKAFFSKNQIAAFSTHIFTTRDDAKEAIRCVDEWRNEPTWKNTHAYSSEKADLKTSTGCRWCDVAVNGDDSKLASQLQQKSFFQRNWKTILACGILGGILLAGLGIATFGIGPLVVAGVAAGVVLGAAGGIAVSKAVDARDAKMASEIKLATDLERAEIQKQGPPNQANPNALKSTAVVTPIVPTTQKVNAILFANPPAAPPVEPGNTWTQKLIETDPTYRPEMDRTKAEAALKDQRPNTYLLRDSSTPGVLAISYIDSQNNFNHILCDPEKYGTCTTVQEIVDLSRELKKLPPLIFLPLSEKTPAVTSSPQEVKTPFQFIIENSPGFYKDMDRKGAEDELSGKPSGTYVIRNSSIKGAFALSLMNDDGRPVHLIFDEERYSHCKNINEIFATYQSKNPGEQLPPSIQLDEQVKSISPTT